MNGNLDLSSNIVIVVGCAGSTKNINIMSIIVVRAVAVLIALAMGFMA